MITAGIVIYIVGAIGTIIYNLSITIGPVIHPIGVLISGIFWPVCLPMLIKANKE